MTNNEYARLEQLFKTQASELDEKLARHVTAISESFDHKIGLIADGHISLHQAIQDLASKTDERFDLVDFKIDAVAADLKATDKRLNKKIDSVEDRLTKKIDGVAAELRATDKKLSDRIDAVATDLKAHRADTEAHGGMYRVKEV